MGFLLSTDEVIRHCLQGDAEGQRDQGVNQTPLAWRMGCWLKVLVNSFYLSITIFYFFTSFTVCMNAHGCP